MKVCSMCQAFGLRGRLIRITKDFVQLCIGDLFRSCQRFGLALLPRRFSVALYDAVMQ